MSVNPTKKTPGPAPVADGRGRGGIGRGGRRKELPILDDAAVDEDAVEPLTRSPSSSPQVSPTRSRSGREKVGYWCHRRHRREERTRRTTSLPMTRKRWWSPSWKQTKCYGTRRRRFTGDPISKPLHGRSNWNNGGRKSLTCKAGSRACVTISHAWTSCPSPGLDSGFSKRWSCGRYRKWTSCKR